MSKKESEKRTLARAWLKCLSYFHELSTGLEMIPGHAYELEAEKARQLLATYPGKFEKITAQEAGRIEAEAKAPARSPADKEIKNSPEQK